MHRYNIISRILLILTISTFALAVPVLVQEKRQTPGDVIIVSGKRALVEDLDPLLEGLLLHDGNEEGAALPANSLQPAEPEVHVPPPNPAGADMHAPPPNPAGADIHAPPPNPAGADVHAPPPNLPYVLVPEGHAPPPNQPFLHVVNALAPPRNPVRLPWNPVQLNVLHPGPFVQPQAGLWAHLPPNAADSDHESVAFDSDAPPGSPHSYSSSSDSESGDSHPKRSLELPQK